MDNNGDGVAILAEEISKRRTKMRMQQTDFAAKSGLNQATVRRLEKGQVKDLRTATKSGVEHALDWPDGIINRILDGTVTRSEIDEVVVRDMTPAVLNSSLEKVWLVSPDGRDYATRSPTDINNLIYAHGYLLREPHPNWPNVAVAEESSEGLTPADRARLLPHSPAARSTLELVTELVTRWGSTPDRSEKADRALHALTDVMGELFVSASAAAKAAARDAWRSNPEPAESEQ